MKKIRLSLVAVALILSTGISLATSAEKLGDTYCSSQPDGGGAVGTTIQFGCGLPGSIICCYRIPDNVVIMKRWQ